MDLNADLGEGFGPYRLTEDDDLLEIVTSASIACGHHAGDPTTMVRVSHLAHLRGVSIGAHPGYPDRWGFGRRVMPMSIPEIEASIAVQVGALKAAAALGGGRLSYVKPHGALYSQCEVSTEIAAALSRAVKACAPDCFIVTSPGSALEGEAAHFGLRAVLEGFADRQYGHDGRLVSRNLPGAVLEDVEAIVEQALRLASGQGVKTREGNEIHLSVQTICLHGDGRSAIAAARAVRRAFEANCIALEPFVTVGV